MSQNYPEEYSHPEQLLEAYALDALDVDEAELVEGHLEECSQCQSTVTSLLQAAAGLASWVIPEALPPDLRSRVMAAISWRQVEPEVQRRTATAVATRVKPRAFNSAWLLPLAAVLVIGLFSASIVMNLRVTDQVDQLTSENSTVAAQMDETVAQTQQLEESNSALLARLDQAEANEAEMANTLRGLQIASYLSVQPDSQPVILEPPSGSGKPEGVLLIESSGQRAILMVSNMEYPSRVRSYHVWLVRDGIRIPMGTLQVDDTGWGALDIIPPEPMFMFDWVNLTEGTPDGTISQQDKMVLHSKIP